MSKAFIIVGATGSGKSTIVKKLTANVHPDRFFVYDVNAEYFEDRDLPDMNDFMNEMKTVKNSVIIFEESTVFFSNRGSSKLMRTLLIEKRHSLNVIFLIFHSIRSIPFYIYDLSNYVFLFKTNDNPKLVESKHNTLFKAYSKVNLDWRDHQAKQLKLFNGKFSPYEIIKLNTIL